MLSNCIDAVGLAKDVARLRNFMDAFLSRRRELKRKRDEPHPSELLAIDASPTEETSRSDTWASGVRSTFYDGNFVEDKELPSVSLSLSMLSFVCKVQQAFDEITTDMTTDNSRVVSSATGLVTVVLDCIIQYGHFCVSSIMNRVNERLKGGHHTFEVSNGNCCPRSAQFLDQSFGAGIVGAPFSEKGKQIFDRASGLRMVVSSERSG